MAPRRGPEGLPAGRRDDHRYRRPRKQRRFGQRRMGIGIVNGRRQELEIRMSFFDAGYGRNPGANVNVVTPLRGRIVSGTAVEFFRNAISMP